MPNLNLSNLSDIEFENLLGRLVMSGDRMTDPDTGRVWPIIRGGDGPLDDEGGDDGDDDGDDGDDDPDDAAVKAEQAKIRRSSAKAARRELVRSLGFGSVGELQAALARLAEGDDSGDDDDDDSAPKGKAKGKPARPAAVSESPEALAGRIAVELASAGLNPEKVKRATRIVQGDIDAGESPSDDDLADLIDDLRSSEPGWFRVSDDDDSGQRRGVPGPKRSGNRRVPDPSTRGSEIFRDRAARTREFKLPTA
jgi:hypothetical protein